MTVGDVATTLATIPAKPPKVREYIRDSRGDAGMMSQPGARIEPSAPPDSQSPEPACSQASEADGVKLSDVQEGVLRDLVRRVARLGLQVPLSLVQRIAAESASQRDRDRWVDSALFLIRTANEPSIENIRLIYEAQTKSVTEHRSASVAHGSALDTAQLESRLLQTLNHSGISNGGVGGGTSGDGGGHQGSDPYRNRVSEMLSRNEGARLSCRYGQLPLLIDGRLVEVDVALFRDRKNAYSAHPLQRMVMSVQTHSLGTVKISVDVVGERLAIAFLCESAAALTKLSNDEDRVRRLASESGWALESVRFRLQDSVGRSAVDVVELVLREGSVDGCL